MTSLKNYQLLNNSDFGDKLAFTAGLSYSSGFILGLCRGLIKGYPKSNKLPFRLKASNILNSIGTQTSKGANAFGSIGILYFITGKVLNAGFEDQLDYLSNTNKNIICGALTGAVYKSTLGLRPVIFGSVLGAGIALFVTQLVDLGNKYGYIGFEIKY